MLSLLFMIMAQTDDFSNPQDVKDIFNVRQLHLGHVAFSFGLRDPPAMIGQSGSSAERKRKKHEQGLAANKQVMVGRRLELGGQLSVDDS
jgi:hypothetical protein